MRNREILFIIKMRNEARAALRGLNTDLKRTSVEAKKASASMGSLNKTARAAGSGLGTVAASAGAAQVGLSRASIAARGLLVALAPLVGALGFVVAIKTLGDFEKQMQAVRAITGATGEQFDALSKEARRLGATTVFSATEAASGMEFLARAGFTAEQAIASLESTLNLAIAGNLGLAEAADIVSNVMQAFGIATTQTAEASDILSFVAASTNTNVQQLGEAMKLAAPVANSLGVSINETAAAIGVLGNAGVQGSLAGTGIRTTLLRLIDTTPKAAAALKSLGLTFDDVNPRTKSLGEIFGTLNKAGLDASRAMEIFGIRTLGTALILKEGSARLNDLAEETKNVGGFAADTARIMQDNLTDSFKGLVSALQEAILTVGEQGFGSALRTTIVTMTEAVRILSGFEGAMEKASTAGRVLATVLKLVGVALGGLLIKKVVVGLLSMVVGFGKFIAAVKLARTGMIALNLAMLANPVGLVIGLVAALAAGLYILFGRTKDLSKEQIELARTTEALKAVQDSAVANSATGLKQQERLLTKQKELLTAQITDAKKQAAELQEFAKTNKGGFFSNIFGSDDSAAKEAQEKVGRLQVALLDTDIALQRVAASAVKNSTAIDGNRKSASALDKALLRVGLSAITARSQLDGILDNSIENRKANTDNAASLELLSRFAKLSSAELAILGTSHAEVTKATKILTAAREVQLTVVQQTLRDLDKESLLSRMSAEDRKIETAVIDARNAATKAGQAFTLADAQAIRGRATQVSAEIAVRKELDKVNAKALTDATKALAQKAAFNIAHEQTLANITRETALIGQTDEARRRSDILFRTANAAKKAGIVDVAGKVQEVNAALTRQKEIQDTFNADAFGGLKAGLASFVEEAKNLNKEFSTFAQSSLNKASDALSTFLTTGKFSFKDFTKSVIDDLTKVIAKQLIANAVAAAFGSGSGSGGSGSSGFVGTAVSAIGAFFQSSGGVVGQSGRRGTVPAGTFANAQRFARGGTVQPRGTDTVPILATPGEVILTERQAGFLTRALSAQNIGGLPPSARAGQASGGTDARQVSNNVTVVMNISTPDVGAFRRSQEQLGAQQAASINRSLRRSG